MSDKETIKAMLKRAGIEYKAQLSTHHAHPPGASIITVERGYFGFFNEFTFNESGELLDLSAWE